MIKAQNFIPHGKTTRILVAPLDWGLGHATRCIPIIKELISLKIEVFIVADKQNLVLLKEEFPSAVFLPHNGYEIEYSRNKKFLLMKLCQQIPRIISRIYKEHRWLRKTVKSYSIDAVISDNRFGMFNKKIPSVYITHQLHIETGSNFLNRFAQFVHYFFIKKYDKCWVPDLKTNGLAGTLSHPKKVPANVEYIGPLSRFKNADFSNKTFDLLISISGPEPQRTIFEKRILSQLQNFRGKVILVRGLPSSANKLANFNEVQIKNHLPSQDLNRLIEQSKMIVCRSGYTSVMDLAALKKKAILVPTPGQTEQEYLATYLSSKKYFFSIKQDKFYLQEALKKAAEFPFQLFNFPDELYKKTIYEFVLSIKSRKFASQ